MNSSAKLAYRSSSIRPTSPVCCFRQVPLCIFVLVGQRLRACVCMMAEKSIAASDGGQETEGESQGREQQATHLASVSISRNVALALGQCLVGRKVRIPRLADATGIITGCNFSRSGALEHVIRCV